MQAHGQNYSLFDFNNNGSFENYSPFNNPVIIFPPLSANFNSMTALIYNVNLLLKMHLESFFPYAGKGGYGGPRLLSY